MRQHLREEVSQILLCPLVRYAHDPSCNRLPASVVSHGVMLLAECRLRYHGILGNCFVVAEDVSRAINGNTEHTKFVTQAFNHLEANFHGTELGPEGTGFHRRLFLAIPMDRGAVDEDKNPRLAPSIRSVSRVVCVNEHGDSDWISSWLGHIGRCFFNGIAVEVEPVIFLEPSFIGTRGDAIEQ